MTKRKCTKTIYEINNLGESYFVSQLKTILRSHDCDIETLKKQITDGVVVKDFTVDGILPDAEGNFNTGYGDRLLALESKPDSEVKVDGTTITKNKKGELQLGETIGYNQEIKTEGKLKHIGDGFYSEVVRDNTSASIGVNNSNSMEVNIGVNNYDSNNTYVSGTNIVAEQEHIQLLVETHDNKLHSLSISEAGIRTTLEVDNEDFSGNVVTIPYLENVITNLPSSEIKTDNKTISLNDNGELILGVLDKNTDTNIVEGGDNNIEIKRTWKNTENKINVNSSDVAIISKLEDNSNIASIIMNRNEIQSSIAYIDKGVTKYTRFTINKDGVYNSLTEDGKNYYGKTATIPYVKESIQVVSERLDETRSILGSESVKIRNIERNQSEQNDKITEIKEKSEENETRIVALENTPSGINPENIGFGLSYKDDKIQLGERLEGLGVEANQIYKEGAYTILGDFKGFQEGKERTIIISEDSKVTVSTRNDANASSLEINPYLLSFGITGGKNFSGFSIGDNILQFKVNDKIIGYNPSNNSMVYNNDEFNGEIATIPFVEHYVSKNTGEVGEVHDSEGIKFRVLNYAENAFMIGDFAKASQNMGASVMVSDEFGTVNFGYNNENGTNQAFVNDEGFTMQKQHNSGRLSSISVEDGAIKLALRNPGKSNTYLSLENEEILMSSKYKKYNSTTEDYEDILMEGSIASAKYVDTKVEELTAIIADLQKQIEELKK